MVITATCCINKYPHRYVNGCDTHSIATRTFLSSIYLFLSLHSSSFFLTVLSSSFLSSRTFVIYTSSVRPSEKENVLSERARETGSIRWYQTFCAARCSLRCKLEPLSVSSTSGVNAIRNSSGADSGYARYTVTRGCAAARYAAGEEAAKLHGSPRTAR